MSTRILSITLLLLVCSLSFAVGSRRFPTRWVGPCCVKLSTGIISDDVTGDTYHESPHKRPCVDAIIFTTQRGDACVDPNLEWVKELTANMTKV
ncbi:hypothetical protein D9C73_021544 [Collichthys lucidus]|uniref:Chemokine interleukin-8-like domain-containing protein n=1 Tax=Collichthys lucidus TaxID=240159 RepID=A0A4U5VI37_COLLU|nr:hypothetical protein D9C73_021544 [Collichthys lucidus]